MAFTSKEREILAALEALAPAHEVDIVDVEVAGTAKAPVVRVRIDHADESLPGISLDELAAQNAWISEVLDELDPFPGSYSMEVSSPGMARPLRRARDFERFAGETVSVATTATEGRRKYTGTLVGMRDGQVVVACEEGEFALDLESIRSAKIKPNYDELARAGKSS